jgi:hypothetical protein
MSGSPNYTEARRLIYAAHDEDPNKHTTADGQEVPYETHYSAKMEKFLTKRAPEASDVLKLAICGQHFRRWEVPRDSYPKTKIGYHSWRTFLKKRQGKLVAEILEQNGYSEEDCKRCQSLIERARTRCRSWKMWLAWCSWTTSLTISRTIMTRIRL